MHRQIESISRRPNGELLGPADHGRILTLAEFRAARGQPGYIYELIDGALVVSPNPVPNHEYWVEFLRDLLQAYFNRRSKRSYFISSGSELEVPGRAAPTRPCPDLAVYRDFPYPPPASWDDVCPFLVVEVVSGRRVEKDTVRNRHLYWQVRGIIEYWVVDPGQNSLEPTLVALRRKPRARAWEEHVVPFGKNYKPIVLLGLSINLKTSASRP